MKGNVTASEKSQVRYLASYVYDDAVFAAFREEKVGCSRRMSWGIYDPNQDRTRETDGVALEYRTSSLESDHWIELQARATQNLETHQLIEESLFIRFLMSESSWTCGQINKEPTFTKRFGFIPIYWQSTSKTGGVIRF